MDKLGGEAAMEQSNAILPDFAELGLCRGWGFALLLSSFCLAGITLCSLVALDAEPYVVMTPGTKMTDVEGDRNLVDT
eukprot:3331235-Amphidinium_carterae.1